MRWTVYSFATGLGSGYAPKAPGTAGSAVGICAVWLCWPHLSLSARILVGLVITGLGVWASTLVERDLDSHDPQTVVIDEIAGIWITMLFFPSTWTAMALGFVLFRLFDIWKPYLIGRAGHLPAGWGVMADDVLAGVAAALVLWPIDRWLL